MMESVDGAFTVRAAGEIDLAGAARFREYLLGAVWMAQREVIIDLRGVTYLDSSALHALIAARKEAEQRGVCFEVAADGFPRKVIDMSGMALVLRLVPEPAA